MALKYIVTLTEQERETLERLLAKGTAAARKLTRARILLKIDAGELGPAWSEEEVVDALDTSASTVYRVRERFVTEGFDAALEHKTPDRVYERRLDGKAEAHLVRLACSSAPEGRTRWTLRLLADQMVELGYVERVSRQTVHQTLKKTSSSRGARSNG
jgi:hypothetical protein